MPRWIYRFERRQYSLAFRYGNGNAICATGFYHLPKFRFQLSKALEISRLVSLDKSLCLVAENALLRIASIGTIMSDKPRSRDFHLRELYRSLATHRPRR